MQAPDRYDFQFTPLSVSDIEEAMRYISDNLCNKPAAERLYHELEKTIDKICLFPYAYADCSCYLIPDKTIRHIRVGNYILIYEVIDENRMIHILRFRYAKMDFTNMDMK